MRDEGVRREVGLSSKRHAGGYYRAMYYILFYDYGENALERRAPYRDEHLKLANASHENEGGIVLAGAYTDPLDGAALVFRTRAAAEAFVKADPYVASGLVTGWRVREWNVVVGG